MKTIPTNFPAIQDERRAAVPTDCAAFHLGRKPQTLRIWAAYQRGPLAPIRVHGRLAWPVDALRKLLCSEVPNAKP